MMLHREREEKVVKGRLTVNSFIWGINEMAVIIHFSQAGQLQNAGSEVRRARFNFLTYTFLNVINLINFTESQIPHLKYGMVDLGECSCLTLV